MLWKTEVENNGNADSYTVWLYSRGRRFGNQVGETIYIKYINIYGITL